VGLVLGGMRFRPCGLPGYFFQPTILTRGRAPAEALREEILGPVLVVSPVDSVQEGLEQALAEGDASRVTLCSSSEPLTARQRESGRCFVGSPPSDAVARSQLSVPGMAVSWAPSPRVLTFPYRLMSGNTPATRGDAGG